MACSPKNLFRACDLGPNFMWVRFDYDLGNRRHAPHNCGLRWITEVLPPALRLLTGNKNQPAVQHFASSANVMLAEFHEEDRAIMVPVPTEGRDFLLSGIDGHERAGPHERIQGVVILSDISK